MKAEQRVAEFIRQWKLGSHNGDAIYGLHVDLDADHVELRVSDLEEILDIVFENSF